VSIHKDDLVEKIQYFLSNSKEAELIRDKGRRRALKEHIGDGV
jgi:spore maturation protein CgeB